MYLKRPADFFRWVITGLATFEDVLKEEDVKARVNRLVDSTIYETYFQKQVKRGDTKQFSGSHSFLMPQQVATGKMIRQKHRDEDTIDLLHRQGVSVSYKWLLRLENRIANTVLEKMRSNHGLYIKGRHTFFAGDNVDFKEDTPDGKRTFHGAIVVMYQRKMSTDVPAGNQIIKCIKESRLKRIPNTVIPLLDCSIPDNKPLQPVFNEFQIESEEGMLFEEQHEDTAIFLTKSLLRNHLGNIMNLHSPEDILNYYYLSLFTVGIT